LAFKKVIVIFFAAILLVPLGGSPPLSPTQIDNPEIKLALKYAESIGLLEYLPNLGPILEAQAQEPPGQMKKLGDEGLMIDTEMTPLQKGIKTAIEKMKGKKMKGEEGKPQDERQCTKAIEDENEKRIAQFCEVPEMEMMVEDCTAEEEEDGIACGDIMKGNKIVGFKLKSKTILVLDKPEKGPKKKDGTDKALWDDFMIGKPDLKGVGKTKDKGPDGKNPNKSKVMGASIFPDDAINDDKDCMDSDGNVFGGTDVPNGVEQSCFNNDGSLKEGFEELVDEDPEDKINDDGDCTDASGKLFGGPFQPALIEQRDADGKIIFDDDGEPKRDPNPDSCFDEFGDLKDGFTEVFNEDNEDGDENDENDVNEDKDCVDSDGIIFGGNGVNDGDANSCFDGMGELIPGFTELIDEDSEDKINNDFDCIEVDINGVPLTPMVVFGGDPTDGEADDCYDENDDLKEDKQELIDEDPSEPFDVVCENQGGNFDMVSGECDLTPVVIMTANNKSKDKTGNTFNPDKDCEDADGNRLGILPNIMDDSILLDEDENLNDNLDLHFGEINSCFKIDGSLKEGFTPLTDEDPVDGINDDGDCVEIELKPNGVPKLDENGEFIAKTGVILVGDDCFDNNGVPLPTITELIDEDDEDGKKLYKADNDGNKNPNAKGQMEYGKEKRRIVLEEIYIVELPEEAIGNNENQGITQTNWSSDDSGFLEKISSSFSSFFDFFTKGIPEANADQAPVEKNVIMGFTFAPPNLKWGIDYKKEACFPAIKLFGHTITPSFCITVFAVFIGYDFGIALGLRLPIAVEVTTIPNNRRAEQTFTLKSKVTPLDFTAKQYFDLCNANPLKDKTNLITNCTKFSFPNFYDEINPFIEDDAKDGDEIVARYTARAGVFVDVGPVRVINWGIDSVVDLGAMCTFILTKQSLDAFSLFLDLAVDPPTNLQEFNDFFKSKLVNCSSFTTPYGFELNEDTLDPNDTKLRAVPIVGREITIRSSCLDAKIFGDVIIIKGRIIPICTGIDLFYAGASLGAGLGLSADIGSKTITADLTVTGDGTRDTNNVIYDTDPTVTDGSKVIDVGPITPDNHDTGTDFVDVKIDDYTYYLDTLQIRGTAILDFGGILGFIPDIPAFTLFTYEFTPSEVIPGSVGNVFRIPIKQHAFTTGIDKVSIRVDNNALATEISTRDDIPNKDTLEIFPGTSKTYFVKGINKGNIDDRFENFEYSGILTQPDDPSSPIGSTLNADTIPTLDAFKLIKTTTDISPGGKSDAISLEINPIKLFDTFPGIYEFTVQADSIGANEDPIIIGSPDPSGLDRRNAMDMINIKVLPFPLPLVFINQEPESPDNRPVNDIPYTMLVQNGGSAPDTITIENEFIDFNQVGCTLTTLGDDPMGCPFRAVPTIIQAEWTNIDTVPTPTGLLTTKSDEPKSKAPLFPFTITAPQEWAGMTETTYQYKVTITSEIEEQDGTLGTNFKIEDFVVTPTKESMVRYIDLEIKELITEIELANEEGVKTGPSLFVAMEAVERTHDKTLNSVLADKFGNADKTLSTTKKMMGAFIKAIEGFDGTANRLGDRFDDWLARSNAIINDIDAAIQNNIPSV